MVTKIYELTRKRSAYFETKYCGIIVKMPFVDGRGSAGTERAEFVTSDRFTQDAVENDPRFGKEFFLAGSFGEEEVAQPSAEEATPKKKNKKAVKTAEDVETVLTINDAYDYFASVGRVVETKEQLLEAMKECNITFSNLDL